MRSISSERWYQLADLRPALWGHLRIVRQQFRGETWHLLRDPRSGRQHRVNAAAYALVGRMDGRLTMQRIWELALLELGDAAPTQAEALELWIALRDAGLVRLPAATDAEALFERERRHQRRDRRERVNPLSLRLSLGDPSRLLALLAPWASRLLTPWAAWGWCLLIGLALWQTLPQAGAVAAFAREHQGAPHMLLTFWLVYPVMKLCHEMAHALALKVWGGEVHDMGVSLLLLVPVPYVDVSDAAGLRARRRRVLVSLMGIIVEAGLAAAGALVWLHVADGVLRNLAFAVMTIGGVSTLLFNGNPLMRFDGYHALADAIDSPGLGPRSDACWRYLFARWWLADAGARPPVIARGEWPWLLGYGLASLVWRILAALLAVTFLSSIHVGLAVLAAGGLLGLLVILPLYRLWQYLATSGGLAGRRGRARWRALTALCLPGVLLCAVPWPDTSVAPGVLGLPEATQVRARADGWIEQVLVQDGQAVAAGEAVLRLSNPALAADFARVDANLMALRVAHHHALFTEPARAPGIERELQRTQAEHSRLLAEQEDLWVRSPAQGRIALGPAEDLPGRHLARGATAAYLVPQGPASVRVVVTQAAAVRLQQPPRGIEVRLVGDESVGHPARMLRLAPAATDQLPSAALGEGHAGPVRTDPADPQGRRLTEPMFEIDLLLPDQPLDRLGALVWARFDHGHAPLAVQGWRQLQQLWVARRSGS